MTPEEIALAHRAVEILNQIRPVLAFGFCLVAAILIVEWVQAMNRIEAKDRKYSPLIANEECKLHGRRLKDCPPESHGGGKTDDPDA